MNNPNWSNRALDAWQVCRNPIGKLSAVGHPPEEITAAELGKLWREATQGREPEAVVSSFGIDYRSSIESFLNMLWNAIVERLQAHGSDETGGLIWWGDFRNAGGGFSQMVPSPKSLTMPRHVYLGNIDVLPDGHWLKTVLDPEGFFRLSSGAPALVLGSAMISQLGNPAPRPFSLIEDALRWTREPRGWQRERERISQENERLERLRTQREAERDPARLAAEVKRLRAEIAELKNEGGSRNG